MTIHHTVQSTRKVTIPMAFECKGKAGDVIIVARQPRNLFRGSELFAIDTSSRPGCGTIIRCALIGAYPVFRDVPTWMFSEWVAPDEREAYESAAKLVGTQFETEGSRAAKQQIRKIDAVLKMQWPTCDPSLNIIFQIEFKTDCQWQAVLWGDTIL